MNETDQDSVTPLEAPEGLRGPIHLDPSGLNYRWVCLIARQRRNRCRAGIHVNCACGLRNPRKKVESKVVEPKQIEGETA